MPVTFRQVATLTADTEEEYADLKAEMDARHGPGGTDEGKLTYGVDDALRTVTLSRVVENYGIIERDDAGNRFLCMNQKEEPEMVWKCNLCPAYSKHYEVALAHEEEAHGNA